MGIDYGTKRVGVALSDELGMIAQPVGFFPATPVEGLLRALAELIRQKGVGLIVVGLPRNMDGTEGPAAAAVRAFAERLTAEFKLPVRFIDERLSTVAAERALVDGGVRRRDRRQKRDAVAAAILLQTYLDSMAR